MNRSAHVQAMQCIIHILILAIIWNSGSITQINCKLASVQEIIIDTNNNLNTSHNCKLGNYSVNDQQMNK